eukprot:CAMPEP_0180682332 /NCGR_PEP_ID=MMETSP1037_2-20121125/70500_1 /TAXON_ID=632150 /ORGANISM="Azadinium spinosum, Strain 3D9" /LENGTH=53 /DNA_ID=CAMNT_0022712317 /DNA_START=29 /DNA_END=191 /DNA_ORIENTATION=-
MTVRETKVHRLELVVDLHLGHMVFAEALDGQLMGAAKGSTSDRPPQNQASRSA